MSTLGMPGRLKETGKWDPKMGSRKSQLSSCLMKQRPPNVQESQQTPVFPLEILKKPQGLGAHPGGETALPSLMPGGLVRGTECSN